VGRRNGVEKFLPPTYTKGKIIEDSLCITVRRNRLFEVTKMER
jgi:hypothetical protein